MRESLRRETALKAARERLRPESAVLTWSGRQRLFVENYRYLISVTDAQIVVRTGYGRVKITGTGLLIDSYTAQEMEIRGNISEITWQQEG